MTVKYIRDFKCFFYLIFLTFQHYHTIIAISALFDILETTAIKNTELFCCYSNSSVLNGQTI